MKQNSELRSEARAALKGYWNASALLTFVLSIIGCVVSGLLSLLNDASSIAAILLLLPVLFAFYTYFLHLFRGEDKDIDYIFKFYNLRVWSTMALQFIYTFLWMLLLIIPGIIKSYSYSMTPYILVDNPEIKNNEAIELSMRMMEGKKMKLFLLDLSFIGWIFLSLFTFGIAFYWLEPYMQTSRAAFYEDIKSELAEALPEA